MLKNRTSPLADHLDVYSLLPLGSRAKRAGQRAGMKSLRAAIVNAAGLRETTSVSICQMRTQKSSGSRWMRRGISPAWTFLAWNQTCEHE